MHHAQILMLNKQSENFLPAYMIDMTLLSRNISSKIIQNFLESEVFKITRATTDSSKFQESLKTVYFNL